MRTDSWLEVSAVAWSWAIHQKGAPAKTTSSRCLQGRLDPQISKRFLKHRQPRQLCQLERDLDLLHLSFQQHLLLSSWHKMLDFEQWTPRMAGHGQARPRCHPWTLAQELLHADFGKSQNSIADQDYSQVSSRRLR